MTEYHGSPPEPNPDPWSAPPQVPPDVPLYEFREAPYGDVGAGPGTYPGGHQPGAAGPPTGPQPGQVWVAPPPGGYGWPPPPRTRRPSVLAAVVVGALLLGGLAGGAAGYVAGQTDFTLGDGIALDPVSGGDDAPERSPQSVAGVAARVLPGVVKIDVGGAGLSGTGTGFVIDATGNSGYIVTNSHVVESAIGKLGRIKIQFHDKQSTTGDLVGADKSSDLAVLKVVDVQGLTALPFGDSDQVAVGDPVLAVGTPLGLAGSVTAGIISAKDRAVTAGGARDEPTYINAIQTDTAINPGNSGGPLVNGRGEVIGVNSAIAGLGGAASLFGQAGSIGVGFAIPANLARRTIDQLIEDGTATHPLIGATLDPQYAGDGAKIVERPVQETPPLVPGGPAEEAGLEPGDVVIELDGRRIVGADELIVGIRAHEPGETIRLTVRRGDEERDVDVVLGSSSD